MQFKFINVQLSLQKANLQGQLSDIDSDLKCHQNVFFYYLLNKV